MHEASLDVSPGKQSVEHNHIPNRRQLFSSPPCVKFKRREDERNDIKCHIKKKPRRRKRKENGGYDMSATSDGDSTSNSSMSDSDVVDVQF